MAATYSVVVTAYNEERLIAAALASVLAQTHGDFELIVVDDGSSDGTLAAVAPFEADPRVRVISQENKGLSAARNTGIEASRSDRVAFLDSDDLWLPDYLEKAHAALESHPDAGFAYTDAWLLQDDNGRFYRHAAMADQNPPEVPPEDPGEMLRMLMERGNFIFVSVTARRLALERAGLFKPELKACEDFDEWIRILACGYGAVRLGDRQAIKRVRGTAMSSNLRNMATNLGKVCLLTETEYDVPDDVKALAHDTRLSIDRDLAALDSRLSPRAAWLALRARLGDLNKKLGGKSLYLDQAPEAVATAFPELARRASSS
jgi:glycosyltransferase involved in cell wall biosynthesis